VVQKSYALELLAYAADNLLVLVLRAYFFICLICR